MYPVDRKYSNEHEWAKQEPDGVVTVGITEYAQEHLGDIVFVAMSQVGSTVNQMDKLGEVESVKSVSDVFSPVSGDILEINQLVIDSPETVNEDPHETGWLAKLRPKDLAELDQLMDADGYQSFLGTLG